jgi:photosystem II stability/assembly factor-like uncharacterized protein
MKHVKKYSVKIFLNRFFITCLLPVFLLMGCGTETKDSLPLQGTWQVAGLQNEHINVIRIEGQKICAATNRDLFCAELSGDLSWESLGFDQLLDDEEWVRDFIRFSDTEYLVVKGHASGRGSDYLAQFVPLYYTDNGGSTWEALENEFTENNAIVNRLEAAPAGDTLYALHGGNIALSTDRGKNWTPFFWSEGRSEWEPHTNSVFLTVDTNHPGNIWTGGMGIIFNPNLKGSSDFGSTWEFIGFSEIQSEGMAWDFLINSKDSQNFMAAVLGVYTSQNKGESWENKYNDGEIRTLSYNSNNEIVVASGKLPSENLFFAATSDFGDNWETIIYENGPSGIIVNDIATTLIDNSEWLFLATNQGLFGYSFD